MDLKLIRLLILLWRWRISKAADMIAKTETYFRKMAPSHRKAYVQWIEQAKKAIHMLLQGKTLS